MREDPQGAVLTLPNVKITAENIPAGPRINYYIDGSDEVSIDGPGNPYVGPIV